MCVKKSLSYSGVGLKFKPKQKLLSPLEKEEAELRIGLQEELAE